MDQHNPFECPICNNWYSVTDDQKRVRSLGCGHSMCTSCLQRLHLHNSITCPQCKCVQQTESVNKIPINFVMESVIHTRGKTPSSGSSAVGSSVLNGGLCEKHETMKLFYCDTCKIFICVHCTVLDHPRGDEHKITDIKEALNNRKSCKVSEIECQIEKLKGVKSTFAERLKILEKAKATHNSILQRFQNLLSQIQKTVADVDAQHAEQTRLKQEIQDKIDQLSVVKQQVNITATLTELSSVEKHCSSSLKETKSWIKVNEHPKEFSQLQKKSDAAITSGNSALSTFDAASTESGREGIIVLHLMKKDLEAHVNLGSIFAISTTYRGTMKKAELKFHNGKLHLPQPVAPDVNELYQPPKDIVLPYSAIRSASNSSDIIVNCRDKGSCGCSE